jgi:hypothetical protein
MRTHQPTIRERPYEPRRDRPGPRHDPRERRTPRHRVTLRNTVAGRDLDHLETLQRILELEEARKEASTA